MPINITDNGLLLESPNNMVGLPTQAFAVTLNDMDIEDMIERVKNGEGIELSLGPNPAFLLGGRDIKILPEPLEYDLYRSTSANPTAVTKLPQPAMSIFSASRHRKPKPAKAAPPKPTKMDKPAARPSAPKARSATPRLGAVPDKEADLVEEDEALTNLKNTYARAEAEKRLLAERRENASAQLGLVSGNSKGGKAKPGKANLLRPQPITTTRSQPSSPSLNALASPSILATVNSAQDRMKHQRAPIIHELAVQELTFNQLLSKLGDVSADELTPLLNKVADFEEGLQKWSLKKLYWKELDVFEHQYDPEEDRQKAIDNAIRWYDRMRIGSTDPLWQKLLPEAERNKGVCLSKLQARIADIASDAAARRQRTATPGVSGAETEKDDSASSGARKGKGGEAMSRSSSQSQSQTEKKKPAAKKAAPAVAKAAPKATPKATPKASTTKPAAAAARGAAAKPARAPLSKEFITSSDDEDEVPLSKPKVTAAAPGSASAAKSAPRPAERAKLPEKKEPLAPKAKPAPAPKLSAARKKDEERDTIRAQPPARPVKAPVKRQREEEEDNDSSTSSTAPLSKRLKPVAKAQPVPARKQPASTEVTQASRTNSSTLAKSKNTSPVKSSPLAVSPPTNASELRADKQTTAQDVGRGRVRDRDDERDTIVSRAGSNRTTSNSTTSSNSSRGDSSIGGRAATNGKKRAAEDEPEGAAKRPRISEEVVNKAYNFKKFYSRYEALHREVLALQDPPSDQVNNLVAMHERLQEMKEEIYLAAPVTV